MSYHQYLALTVEHRDLEELLRIMQVRRITRMSGDRKRTWQDYAAAPGCNWDVQAVETFTVWHDGTHRLQVTSRGNFGVYRTFSTPDGHPVLFGSMGSRGILPRVLSALVSGEVNIHYEGEEKEDGEQRTYSEGKMTHFRTLGWVDVPKSEWPKAVDAQKPEGGQS